MLGALIWSRPSGELRQETFQDGTNNTPNTDSVVLSVDVDSEQLNAVRNRISAELEEEAAQEQAIGATTRRITASLGSAASRPMQVGAWAATLPRIGSAVPRLH